MKEPDRLTWPVQSLYAFVSNRAIQVKELNDLNTNTKKDVWVDRINYSGCQVINKMETMTQKNIK